jgi:hypothetical protein
VGRNLVLQLEIRDIISILIEAGTRDRIRKSRTNLAKPGRMGSLFKAKIEAFLREVN